VKFDVNWVLFYVNIRSVGWVLCSIICLCLTSFVPYFGMSAWHLKCTKLMGSNSDVVHCRICVRTEDKWAKKLDEMV
jgi:uncharacterized membrane protein YccF (DUF307 family)